MSNYTSYELTYILNSTHSNVKSCIQCLIEKGIILQANIKDIKEGRKRFFILTKQDFLKVIFQLRPQIAYLLYSQNVTL